jgi:hypothetical protein
MSARRTGFNRGVISDISLRDLNRCLHRNAVRQKVASSQHYRIPYAPVGDHAYWYI